MRAAWLTDIHLNFLEDDARREFYAEIVNINCDIVLISGDIAEAPCLLKILREMARKIKKPIYFTLGNHDYYRTQIDKLRKIVMDFTKTHNQLIWLPAAGIIKLNNDTVLLGQDGWADGRFGDYQNSRITLNDSRMITDLFQKRILGRIQLLEKMQQLADADAMQLQNNLTSAVNQQVKKIIVLTHVPPYKEACLYNGKISDNDWLPYFSSKVMGDILLKIAQENTAIKFLVLCGHTHSEVDYRPLSNLIIKVGKAEYCQPSVQEIIALTDSLN
jgi:predicted phosphohydrolase